MSFPYYGKNIEMRPRSRENHVKEAKIVEM